MVLKTEDLFDKAIALSKNVDDTFLELGRTLRQLQDREPQLFQEIVSKSHLGRRKAYYLVDVSRVFDPLQVSRAKLKKVGWTKLAMIAKQVRPDNIDQLLDLAEQNNVRELERIMRGEEPLGAAHCVLMYFSPKEYDELEEALVRHGARKAERGRGLVEKEQSLLKMIRKAMGKREEGQAADRAADIGSEGKQ